MKEGKLKKSMWWVPATSNKLEGVADPSMGLPMSQDMCRKVSFAVPLWSLQVSEAKQFYTFFFPIQTSGEEEEGIWHGLQYCFARGDIDLSNRFLWHVAE